MKKEGFDLTVKQALEERVQDVTASPYLLERIKTEAEAESRKERNFMGISKKIAVAAAICVMSVTAYAAVSSLAGVSSHTTNNIRTFAQLEKAEDTLGMDAKFVESFSNGMTFSYAGTGEEQGRDENGNEIGTSYKMLSITYEGKNGEDMTLTVSDGSPYADAGMETSEGYVTLTNKFVPTGYEPTEEELALQEAGKLNIGYGGANQEVQTMQSEAYYWQDGGLYYNLIAFDLNLGEDAMAQMAKEIMG